MLDFHFLICFYICNGDWNNVEEISYCDKNYTISAAIVNSLPAWWRFLQCLRRYRDSKEAFPHLANAGKYSTTLFVITFNALKSIKASMSRAYILVM